MSINRYDFSEDSGMEIEIEGQYVEFYDIKPILEAFVKLVEKTQEYDKVGQTYYNAKNLIK